MGPDVIAEIGKNDVISFEIETGSSLEKLGVEKVRKKFERLRDEYNETYIVATNWILRNKYPNFGKAITRNEIEPTIENPAQRK